MEDWKFADCLIENNEKIDLQRYKDSEDPVWAQEILNISDAVLDKYYDAAHHLLNDKRYEDAACAFTFLCFLTPLYSSFWLGLGIAEQFKGEYEAAIMAYIMAMETSPDDPAPYANLAQCFIALSELKAAQFIIEKGLELCADHPEQASIKDKILALQGSFDFS